ncbi:molybdopterin molybdotransferase MoeA [Methylophilaceae bacterium]|nr:molybdopterin molybdotransferase MoeA [Methylophilaceae bacterium]
MKKIISLENLVNDPGCLSEYDPNAMTIEDARKYIHNFLKVNLETEFVNTEDALDRILGETIISKISVPNYNNSAMDGFAFNLDSLIEKNTLKVATTILAGDLAKQKIKPGFAAQVMTGSKIPDGTDTVLPFELVKQENDSIVVNEIPKKGVNIRRLGEDIKKNGEVLKKGVYLRPAEIGLIASIGISRVKVFKKLKVSFFSTGDEVVKAGQPIKSGQVYDSNHFTIQSMLRRINVECIDLGIIPDDKKLIEKTFNNAAKISDAIITTGGVSVGKADYMKDILKKLGKVLFWKLSIKPGRPMAYGAFETTPYFGLPGNPVAAMITFYQLVQPALKYLMGHDGYKLPTLLKAKCAAPITKRPGRMEFQRGFYNNHNGELSVKPTPHQGSGILSSMSKANCLIVLDMDQKSIKVDDYVNIQLMEGLV